MQLIEELDGRAAQLKGEIAQMQTNIGQLLSHIGVIREKLESHSKLGCSIPLQDLD